MARTRETTTKDIVDAVCRAAREASARMGQAGTTQKNAALAAMAKGLRDRAKWLSYNFV